MTSIFLKTYGCSMNYSDSEVMKGLLKEEGYDFVDNKEDADIIIINTCTVKDSSEDRFLAELKKHKKAEKPLIVCGCIAQADPEKLEQVSLLGVHNINHIVEVVEETLQGNVVHFLKRNKNPRLNLPKVRKNKFIEIIPINQGCVGACAYCKTKLARGTLMSYDPKEIVKQAEAAVKEGIKEIWITSQDTGAYGLDINYTLPQLIKDLVAIKGEFWIRLGMINPDHAFQYLEELTKLYENPKILKFIHMPLQSGSEKVLKDMKRKYTVKEFEECVKMFRNRFPNITIATDIICGFPTETEDDFEETLALMKKYRFPVINISKYCARRGTEAAAMKQHSTNVIKERSKLCAELFRNHVDNSSWLNWEGEVFVDEIGKEGTNTVIARNDYYKQILLKGGKELLGKKLNVKIKEARLFDLIGESL